jgi:hypothetical protein
MLQGFEVIDSRTVFVISSAPFLVSTNKRLPRPGRRQTVRMSG